VSVSVAGLTAGVRREARAWCEGEGWHWVFIVKTLLAALLALLISLRFDLDQPRTAMITVFVVMQPHTGMVLTKSLYRIGGTLAGTLASLLLVSLCAQQGALFIVGLALWVGGCTAGAAFYRNFKSYGCVLAGYTAAMIGIPAALAPLSFFDVALSRLTEVTLGILCAGVVSDVILPRRLSDVIAGNVRSRYLELFYFLRRALAGPLGQKELEGRQARIVGYVISLEAVRSAGFLEDPEVRSRDRRLRRLNGEFMAVTTTFHSLRLLSQRLTRTASPVGEVLGTLYHSFGSTLELLGGAPGSAEEAYRLARSIAAFRAPLRRRVAGLRRQLALHGPEAQVDFETSVELMNRFVRELHAYSRSYAALLSREDGPKPPDDVRFASRTDPLVALLTGGRALVAILLVGAFWIVSAWPYGSSALLFVAVVCALLSMAPDPPKAARGMVLGFFCGLLAALLFKFAVLPSLSGFALLCAGIAPLIMLGLYLAHSVGWFDAGIGFVVFFTTMLAPGNPMRLAPEQMLNEGCATVLGITIAGLMFQTLFPVNGAWLGQRLTGQMRRLVVLACFLPLEGLLSRFESGTYDLLFKLSSVRGEGGLNERGIFSGLFPVIEIGRAVLHLREDAASPLLSPALSDRLARCVREVAKLFEQPSAARRDRSVALVEESIEALREERQGCAPGPCEPWRRLLSSLHLIRCALLDDETELMTTIGSAQPMTEQGVADAA